MTESRGLKDRARGRGGRLRPYLGTVVALAAVFGGSALIGAHVRAGKSDAVKIPTGAASPDGLALPVKPTVPVTITVYEDLRSPVSKAFAARFHDTFDAMLHSGQAQLWYRLVTTTDAAAGGDGSAEAANAAACAQDQGRFAQYVDQLWLRQPADTSDDAFSSEKLLKSLARKAHKIKAAAFVPCVQGMDHEGWVERSTRDFSASGYTSVPVVEVNGVVVADGEAAADRLTPAKLRALVRKAAARAAAANAARTAARNAANAANAATTAPGAAVTSPSPAASPVASPAPAVASSPASSGTALGH